MKKLIVLIGAAAIAVAPVVFAHEGEEHEAQKEITVKGEVIDIACYVEHNGSGEKHIACAKMCMENGLPVGIKANDGKTYLLVGDHKPLRVCLESPIMYRFVATDVRRWSPGGRSMTATSSRRWLHRLSKHALNKELVEFAGKTIRS